MIFKQLKDYTKEEATDLLSAGHVLQSLRGALYLKVQDNLCCITRGTYTACAAIESSMHRQVKTLKPLWQILKENKYTIDEAGINFPDSIHGFISFEMVDGFGQELSKEAEDA